MLALPDITSLPSGEQEHLNGSRYKLATAQKRPRAGNKEESFSTPSPAPWAQSEHRGHCLEKLGLQPKRKTSPITPAAPADKTRGVLCHADTCLFAADYRLPGKSC